MANESLNAGAPLGAGCGCSARLSEGNFLANLGADGHARRLGVMGGTFDPIHNGHLEIARCACESLGLSGVLFVVAGDPWMKHGRALTPAEDRFAMVQAAIEGDVRFAASRMEIDRAGETYTVDTLRELRRILPAHVELCFLMGADAAALLGEWREASELGALARFAVVSQRDDVALDERGLSRLAQIIGAREILQVEMPRMDVSSTNLREKVRTRRSIRAEVPAVVADYIESHRLYQR